MSTVQEIEAAIPHLTPREQEQLRAWLDEFLENQLDLTDEVKAKLDQSRSEIAEGNYRTRQPG
jgi:DNA replication protein DnaD